MMANDYGILYSSISVRNPQANAIVERVHQTIGNIICTFINITKNLDNENLKLALYYPFERIGMTYIMGQYVIGRCKP